MSERIIDADFTVHGRAPRSSEILTDGSKALAADRARKEQRGAAIGVLATFSVAGFCFASPLLLSNPILFGALFVLFTVGWAWTFRRIPAADIVRRTGRR